MKQRNLMDLFHAVYRRKIVILLIIMSSLLTAGILSKMLSPIYEAEVLLLTSSQTSNYGLGLSAIGETGSYVLTNLPNKEMRAVYLGMLGSVTVARYVAANVPERKLRQIRRSAKFGINKNNIMKINVLDKDPNMAAKIANLFAESFGRFLENISSQEAKSMRVFSEEQLRIAYDELTAAEEKLKTFKERHELSSIEEQVSSLVEENAKLESERRLLMVDIQENETQLQSTEKLLGEQTKMEKYSEIIADNPIVEQLRSNLVALEVQLAGVKSDYGDSHIRTVAINTQIEEAKNQLKEEVEKLVVSETSRIDPVYENLTQNFVALQVTKSSLQARKEALDVVIQQVGDLLSEMPERSQEYARLLRDMNQAEEVYKMMDLKVEDAKMEEAHVSERLIIVDKASVPEAPAFPRLKINILVSFGFSIIISIFFCFLLEYIEDLRKSDSSQNNSVIREQ